MGIAAQSLESLGFGIGLYSYADAARFIGGKPAQLRRWLKGYGPRHDGQPAHAPLWTSQLAEIGIDGLGFRDLIEARFIQTFAATGVPLKVIRHTIEELRERLGVQYPFTSTRFKTDGRRIFMELLGESGGSSLVDVARRQDVMKRVIAPSLRSGVELGMDDMAARWFPVHGSREVVLDPDRKFGQPILTRFGVPTAAIVDSLRPRGSNARHVARIYEIPEAAVHVALSYERQIASCAHRLAA